MSHLAIVIPFFNGDDFLKISLKSILILKNNIDFTIYIVNNNKKHCGKNDITYGYDYDKITIINTQPAIGFGRACNIGVIKALNNNCDYILILNQDTILEPNTLQSFFHAALETKNKFCVYSPMLFDYDFRYPSKMIIQTYVMNNKEYLSDTYNGYLKNKYELSTIGAACIFMHRSVIEKIGLFDPVFYHYGEDFDFFKRLNKNGGKLYLLPKIRVAHYETHLEDDEQVKLKRDFLYLRAQVIKKIRYFSILHTVKYIISTFFVFLLRKQLKMSFSFLWSALVSLSKISVIRKDDISSIKKRIASYIEADSKGILTTEESPFSQFHS